jgi:hypothetical protein
MGESFLYRPGHLANTSMKSLVIGAPFGNYLERPYATSTVGTFTLTRRGGVLHRWWRVLSTLRYNSRIGGLVNKLGLPNPGIYSVHANQSSRIVSVYQATTSGSGTEPVMSQCPRSTIGS